MANRGGFRRPPTSSPAGPSSMVSEPIAAATSAHGDGPDLDLRLKSFEDKIDARFSSFEEKIYIAYQEVKDQLDASITSQMKSLEDRIDARLEKMMSILELRLKSNEMPDINCHLEEDQFRAESSRSQLKTTHPSLIHKKIAKKSEERTVHSDCINASNPYHECSEYCFMKIVEAKEMIEKVESVSPLFSCATTTTTTELAAPAALAPLFNSIKVMQQSAKALKLVGDVHANNSGGRGKARKFYESALRLEPGFLGAALALVELHVIEGRNRDAISLRERYLKDWADDSLHIKLVQVFAATNILSKALSHYQAALIINPQNEAAKGLDRLEKQMKGMDPDAPEDDEWIPPKPPPEPPP